MLLVYFWLLYVDYIITCEALSKSLSQSCPNQSKFMAKEATSEAKLQFVNGGGLPRGQRGFAVGSG